MKNIEKRSLDRLGTKPKVLTLVLIDSNAIIHRAYHALPKTMRTRKGEYTNAVYGFVTTFIKVLEDLKPDYIAASFDISKATFRLAEYAEYKAHRVAADQELYDQIPRVKEFLETVGVPIYVQEGFEADDVIGTIAAKLQITNNKYQINSKDQIPNKEDFKVFIVTGDKDAFQLIDGNIFVYNLKHGLQSAQIVDRAVIKEEWGLDPEDFIDLKALAGDPSDNIPGVPGIGPKTAIDLLQRFDTLEKLYEKIAEISNAQYSTTNQVSNSKSQVLDVEKMNGGCNLEVEDLPSILIKIEKEMNIRQRIAKLLFEYKDQAFLSQRLATIRRDVPVDFKLKDCEWGDYDKGKLIEFFKEVQFTSLLKRFGVIPADEPKTKEAKAQKEKDDQLKLL
ncbi:MAG: 5'-3' exonuclease H3TH domain-containing protein [Patescibacteria group bacterium]